MLSASNSSCGWRRWVQFRLRSLFVVTTMAAIVCGVEARRKARERAQLNYCDRVDFLVDTGNFEEAIKVADAAVDEFPDDDLMLYLALKPRILQRGRGNDKV